VTPMCIIFRKELLRVQCRQQSLYSAYLTFRSTIRLFSMQLTYTVIRDSELTLPEFRRLLKTHLFIAEDRGAYSDCCF